MSVGDDTVIQRCLRPGERIVWTGRPQPWRIAWPVLPGLLFLSIWLLMPVSMTISMLSGGDNAAPSSQTEANAAGAALFFLFFPGLFLAVGGGAFLWLLRRLIASWRHYYALTDQRGIIIVDLWPRSVKSFGPSAFAEMTRSGGERRGTIAFGAPKRWPDPVGFYGTDSRFVSVPEPARVEELIQTLFLERQTESLST